MKRRCLFACLVIIITIPGLTRADVITDWNEITLGAVQANGMPATRSSRLLAMVHIAMYDSINSLYGAYKPFYRYTSAPRIGTSPEAAAISAAYTVLINVVPDPNGKLYKARAASLSQIPDSYSKSLGISWGTYVGSYVAQIRKGDGSSYPSRYIPIYLPGYWRPTPPAFKPALDPIWQYVMPFVINLKDFTLGPPPAVSSSLYAQDVNETKLIGAKNSPIRTPDQTDMAIFWADDSGSVSPPGRWNKVAQVVSQQMGNSLYQNARLFALLNIAMADGTISCWQCKFKYALWRPITAIREANSAGNPLIIQDPTWEPLLITPAFPEYIPGHSALGGTGAEIMKLFYGTDDISFTLYSEVTKTSRSFNSFSQAGWECGRSRIYGGIHYEFSNILGENVGREIGQYVFTHALTPVY